MSIQKRIGFALTVFALAALGACSKKAQVQEVQASKADSIIYDAGIHKDYGLMLALADSFELTGDISVLDANRWRGVAYYRQRHFRMAEICYRKAVDCEIRSSLDQQSYNKSARRLSEMLLLKGDYEGALRVSVDAVKKMDNTRIGSDIDYAILLNNIGCCQLNLGRDAEANESFLKAREHYANRWQSDSTGRGILEAVVGTVNTSMAYINTRRHAEAIYWIDRTEMLLNIYRQKPDARSEDFDEYQGRIEIMRAVALQGMGKREDAAKAYQAYCKTAYSKTDAGLISANEYLVEAQRYAEAADNYRFLDRTLSNWDMELSLDLIQLYLLPKYRANKEAGRRDSAHVAGERILTLLDSVITNQKNSETAELATIYDTNQKKEQITRQQADMARQRYISALVALGLIITFLSTFIYFRNRSAVRLKHAHQALQTAYGQLEETTAAKERIESELRIARDIQMSMVPNTAPDHDGLDLYAAMTPAKEVGGDLYGYLLTGDALYFCVGDVSGKGVPASLFMAQATRLFRTLATQGMKPAEIATRMNAALSENNDQGMFVTMFLGLVNMGTGHMSFCNAGHNPPVIGGKEGGEFLEMLPNAPIGLWPGLEYEGEEIDNIKGRPLFAYTDGLNEAENRQQEQFGDDRLLAFLKEQHYTSAKLLIERLKAEVDRHRDGAEPNDDLTMLCLRVE